MKRILFLGALLWASAHTVFASYLQNPFRDKPVYIYDLVPVSSENDRPLGAFMGLIIGDMLGIPLEFIERKMFSFDQPKTEAMRQALWPTELLKIYLDVFSARHFNALGWYPGEWSDNVSITLCLAASLIETDFNLKDQLEKWTRWRDQGYMSYRKQRPDNSLSMSRTLTAFEKFKDIQDFDWTTLGTYNKHSFTQKLSEGNSALMRVTPLVVWAWTKQKTLQEILTLVRDHVKLTHGAPKAIESAIVLGAVIWKGLSIAAKDDVSLKKAMVTFTPEELGLMDLKDKDILNVVHSRGNRDWRQKESVQIKATGFSVDTLEAALWAFHQHSSFEKIMRESAALGGDTGTLTSVTGQIAGVCYGIKSFPKEWLERLWGYDILMAMGHGLIKK